jgi:hypothetical protein
MRAKTGLNTFLTNRWQMSRMCLEGEKTGRSCIKPLMLAATYTIMDFPGVLSQSDMDLCPHSLTGQDTGMYLVVYTLVYNPMPLDITVWKADANITWVGDTTINASTIPQCKIFLPPDGSQCTDRLKMARAVATSKDDATPVVTIPAGSAAIWKTKACVLADPQILMAWLSPNGYLNHRYYPDQNPLETDNKPFPANITGDRPFPLIMDIEGVVKARVGDNATGFTLDVPVHQTNVPGLVPLCNIPDDGR